MRCPEGVLSMLVRMAGRKGWPPTSPVVGMAWRHAKRWSWLHAHIISFFTPAGTIYGIAFHEDHLLEPSFFRFIARYLTTWKEKSHVGTWVELRPGASLIVVCNMGCSCSTRALWRYKALYRYLPSYPGSSSLH